VVRNRKSVTQIVVPELRSSLFFIFLLLITPSHQQWSKDYATEDIKLLSYLFTTSLTILEQDSRLVLPLWKMME